ncbi:MAG: hypothetical protein L0Y80_04455 [Ignavibacteriae bacterium]|nr:hypothetical protein [Ignavibacteriota bacterium]
MGQQARQRGAVRVQVMVGLTGGFVSSDCLTSVNKWASMARAKMYCIGKNQDGVQCSNWAIRGSMYCHEHQHQETDADKERMKESQWSAGIVLFVLVFLGFIIASIGGCQKEFFQWLPR